MQVKSATEALQAATTQDGKPTPEAYEEVMIRAATSFSATIKTGQGTYWSERFPTLIEAAAMTRVMTKENRTTHQPNVYAILESGASVMVTNAIWRDLLDRVLAFTERGGDMQAAVRMKPNFKLLERR